MKSGSMAKTERVVRTARSYSNPQFIFHSVVVGNKFIGRNVPSLARHYRMPNHNEHVHFKALQTYRQTV